MKTTTLLIATLLSTLPAAAGAQTTRPATAPAPGRPPATAPAATRPAGKVWALLIGGQPGSALYAERFRDWIARFHFHLTRECGVPAAQIVVLSGDAGYQDAIVHGPATAAAVKATVADLARRIDPRDQFILFIVGHGQVGAVSQTLILPGPDLAAEELGPALEAIAARNQVILNFSGSSGAFLKALARPGRVNVTATAAGEFMEPVYCEFFLRGLISRRADGEGGPDAGTRDGVVTLLEAYNWASYETPKFITRIRTKVANKAVDASAGWRVDGRESVEIFRKLYAGRPDEMGGKALDPASRADVPEEDVHIRPLGNPDQWITGRRVIVEHALLEDCGEEEGVSTLAAPEDKPEYIPAAGRTPGMPGHLARRVVLGRAELLPPPPPATQPAPH